MLVFFAGLPVRSKREGDGLAGILFDGSSKFTLQICFAGHGSDGPHMNFVLTAPVNKIKNIMANFNWLNSCNLSPKDRFENLQSL